jgi:hypothetical protein
MHMRSPTVSERWRKGTYPVMRGRLKPELVSLDKDVCKAEVVRRLTTVRTEMYMIRTPLSCAAMLIIILLCFLPKPLLMLGSSADIYDFERKSNRGPGIVGASYRAVQFQAYR